MRKSFQNETTNKERFLVRTYSGQTNKKLKQRGGKWVMKKGKPFHYEEKFLMGVYISQRKSKTVLNTLLILSRW